MKRGKLRIKFFAAFVMAFLYIVFFPAASGKELFLVRDWAADLEPSGFVQPRSYSSGEIRFFRLSDRLGYIDEQGSILFQEDVAYDAAMEEDFFVNYSALPFNLVMRGRRGEFLANIDGSGYPFTRGGKLFLVSPGGYALSRVDADGRILWEREFPAMITATDAGNESVVIGLLDGGVIVLGDGGNTEYELSVEREGLPVTLQTGIAADGLYFAAVAGGRPQRLMLFAREDLSYSPVFVAELPGSYRRAIVARYYSAPDYFVFEQPGGAGVLQSDRQRLFYVRLPGELLALADERPGGLFLALSAADDATHASAFMPNGSTAFNFSYEDSSSGETRFSHFLRAGKDDFLLGTGTRLYRVRLEVM